MYQPPRGTRDFLPEEMLRRNWVLDKIREVYEVYGFEPLGTPAFESWDLLKVKSGDDVINQIYYFRDKSDRELGLRFEWTTSLARVVASHREIQMPFKRYAIGPVWRYENPSEKRFREFWQADADTIGVAGPIADSECIAAAVDCLRRLGFEGFVISLNHRRLMEAFIHLAGLPLERSLDIIRAVDKLTKIGRDEVIKELSKITPNEEASVKLLDYISITGDPASLLSQTRELLKNDPEGLQACDCLAAIVAYSALFGYREYINVDLSLARGLDYYTGPIFEVLAKGYEDYGSIAGGGRYDEIIGLFGGEPTPATGISLGVERIVLLLEMKQGFEGLKLGSEVLVAAISEVVVPEAILITQELRTAGILTLMDLTGRRLSKQLEYANKKSVRKVVIVGEKDIAGGNVTVRDMSTGEQEKVEREELLSFLRA